MQENDGVKGIKKRIGVLQMSVVRRIYVEKKEPMLLLQGN